MYAFFFFFFKAIYRELGGGMFEPNVRKTRGTWAVPAWARQLAVGRSPAWGGAGWGAGPAANSGCPILRKPKC